VLIRKSEGGLDVDSVVMLNQVRSVDKQRLIKRLGRVTAGTMQAVDRAISLSLGLIDLS
jgi:mRNA interferase MazF